MALPPAIRATEPPSVYDFTSPLIDNRPGPLAAYRGKVLLIVNGASRCKFTRQYAGLESLYRKYKDRGFLVLLFPANNFAHQEPGSNEEIRTFCQRNYGVTFPLFAKVSVQGWDIAPLYQFLTDSKQNPKTGGEIEWNFTKFLVGRDGKVLARFASEVEPDANELAEALEAALASPKTPAPQ